MFARLNVTLSLSIGRGIVRHSRRLAVLAMLTGLAASPLLAATPTTTTLAASSSTVTAERPVTLTATVKANGNAVGPGQVVFCNASAPYCEDLAILGTAQITSNGSASLKLLLPVGTHSIYAKFLGTKGAVSYAASSSSATPQKIVVTGGQDPVDAQIMTAGTSGDRTLSATVNLGAAAGTGTVSFKDIATNKVIATAPLEASTSRFSLDGGTYYPADIYDEINITDPNGFFGVEPLTGDFNGDGVPDVLNVNGYYIALSPGNPAHPGNFLPAQYSTYFSDSAPVNVSAAEVGDFNGDGVIDLAAVMSDPLSNVSNLVVSFGDASHPGQFLPGKLYALPSVGRNNNAQYISVGDFNGDGLPDVAVSFYVSYFGDSDPTFAVLLNDASNPGQFLAPQSYLQTNFAALSMATADFDGDGVLDIALAGFTEHDDTSLGAQLSIFRGDPANPGKFLSPTTVNAGEYQVQSFRVGDFNGDGLPDIIVASNNILGREESGPPAHNQLDLLLNDASHPGSFLAPKVYSQQPFGGPINLATGDFNGDGLLDVALSGDSTSTQGLMIYTNNPADRGVFLTPVLYQGGLPLLAKNQTDLNGDGLTDLAWVGTGVYSNNDYSPGYYVQLARRTETATAYHFNSGTTDYASALYSGDVSYAAIASCEIPLDAKSAYPTILNPTVSNMTGTSATISWTSNVPTYGVVQYEVVASSTQPSPVPESTRWDPTETAAHSFVISDLTPGAGYQFTIFSQAYFSGCDHYSATYSGSFTAAKP